VDHELPTRRQLECLQLAAQGLTTTEIGLRLSVSPRTVEHHLAKLCERLGVRTRVQAVALAIEHRWLPSADSRQA
jgi:LuxR family transcriptional regulator, transcriptional regulator of spore coat protein